jgi:hypothetical protein
MHIIKNIGVIFIVSLLILATGGVSVFHHICHCAGEMSASLFVEADCDHSHSGAACCSAETTASCCQVNNNNEPGHSCDNKDCCQDTMQFLKISDSFQPGVEKIIVKPFLATISLIFIDKNEDIKSLPNFNIYASDLPPPDTGKQIVVSLHQLKLDPHLV